MAGGKGQDTFRFELGPEDIVYEDVILDLQAGDRIDMSVTDADATTGGDQAFVLVRAFSGRAGEVRLRYLSNLDFTVLEGDLDGDGEANLGVLLTPIESEWRSRSLAWSLFLIG